jgi:SAM-dependent methyltransferase
MSRPLPVVTEESKVNRIGTDSKQAQYRGPLQQTTCTNWEAYWQSFEAPDHINYTPQIIDTLGAHIDLQGCRILEIGAGTGGNSSALASLGAAVTALDLVWPALQRIVATGRKTGVGLDVVQGDAWHLPFRSGAFDLIFHQGFLEHFRAPRDLVHEQRRVLRKLGYILIDVPQRYSLYTIYKKHRISRGDWDYGGWETEFSYRRLRRMVIECGFRPVESYGRDVFPYLISTRNQLKRLEKAFLKARGFPPVVWRLYDGLWHRLERSNIGRNTLMCIGILAQKV